jgi:hypothetical protein
VESVFENLTAYKNRNGAIWGRGEMHVFRNVKAADNAIGYTHASGSIGRDPFTSKVIDSLFVGESENIGNPKTDAEKAYGRSLPKPELPDFPIRGYEYYDFRHDIVNTTFRNYEDNATRKTGAISNLLFSSFGVSTNNAFEKVKFENAKPVYFPPMERKWANDNGGSSSYKTAAYTDRDGSLGHGPNSFVIIHDGVNDSIAVDTQACEIKPTWNAAVCKGDVGRMNIGGGGGGGGGFGGGRGAGPGGAAGAPGAGPGAAPARAGAPGPGAGAPPGAGAGPGMAPRAGGPGAPGAAGPGAGAPRAGGAGAPGGRAGGAGAAPAQPPIVLSRNGKDYTVTSGNVRAGTEIKVTTERPSVNLSVTELDAGSWVIFELPGFNTAAAGTATDSLDALRKATATAYYKGNGSLWVKLVSPGDPGNGAPGGGASLLASR